MTAFAISLNLFGYFTKAYSRVSAKGGPKRNTFYCISFQGRQLLLRSSGRPPFLSWVDQQYSSAPGAKIIHNNLKINLTSPSNPSTVKQFTTSTVSTSMVTSTENISLATFPKVVICNKYKLRQVICLFTIYYSLIKHYFLSNIFHNAPSPLGNPLLTQ